LRKVIIDTDPGVDDALALMLAFNSPELRVEAVTTVSGNVSQEKGHGNALKILEFLGITDVPVVRGAERPLLRGASHAEEFHGKTGLGEAVLPEPGLRSDERPAVEVILEEAEGLGRDLTLVAIGPLTNIASAVLAEPELPQMVGGLIIMGGAYQMTTYGFGNANAVAEFNVWHDPEAAKIVFDSVVPIAAVGLDVTTDPKNRLSRQWFDEIEVMGTRRAMLVGDLCRDLVRRFNGFSLHDPMALAYAVDPTMFETKRFKVEVETAGELTRGMTVVDRRAWRRAPEAQANVEIVVDVDEGRFLDLFMERVAGGG